MRKYNVAVVGVGAVGEEMLRVLRQRNFPLNQLKVFARSARTVHVDGQSYRVEALNENSFKGMDIALSGILTNLRQKLESKKHSLPDLAFSLQETVFAMLVEVSERALAHTEKKELLLGGGGACYRRRQRSGGHSCSTCHQGRVCGH